jgi:hypothetical protein
MAVGVHSLGNAGVSEPGLDHHDNFARLLYTTADISRVGALSWSTASKLAGGQIRPTFKQANFLASRFAVEVLNPRDAGARWCSAAMLRELSPLLVPRQA